MSARELVVLGTASQVPTRHRNHNGYLLRWDADGLLFDPGEGTQRQFVFADVSASAITRILVTHFHGDHCLGLAGMCQRLSLDGAPHTVHVHFPASGQVFYDRLRHASIFYDGADIAPHPIAAPGVIAEAPGWTLSALALDHGVDTFGYRLEERAGRTMLPDALAATGVVGPAIGRLQREGQISVPAVGEGVGEAGARTVRLEDVSVPRPGQVFAFVMDTRLCDSAYALAAGADLLVCESTYLEADADKARAHGHLTARQAADIARAAGARKLVLSHFSQRYPSVEPFLAEARAVFPNAVAARDLDVITVPPRVRA